MITNKHNLPQEVYDALCKNRYAGDSSGTGGYSATSLIAPLQQTLLKRRHPDCNSEDAIDRVWSLFGHLAHSLLEEHGSDETSEVRYFTKVLGEDVSGQVDVFKNCTITDYKTTSAWKICKQSFGDWEAQLNIYAYLCRKNGLEVNFLRIIAIIRDWSATNIYQPNYPKTPIIELPLTLWSFEEQEAFVERKIRQIQFYKDRGDDDLLPCTNEERWMAESKWAVMKPGTKRANRVFDTFEEANVAPDYLEKNGLVIVERLAEPRRCLKYCSVSQVCVQHQNYLKETT